MIDRSNTRSTEAEVSIALLAIKHINDGGGVRVGGVDYQLELVAEDHGRTPELAVQAMGLLAEKGVTAIVGPPWSSLALGSLPDHSDGVSLSARAHDMLLISPSATSQAIAGLADDDLQWRTTPSDAVQASVAATTLVAEGIMTASVLHRDEPWGTGLAEAFRAAYEAQGGRVLASVGYDVEGDEILDVNAYDYAAELSQIFTDQPEAVLLFTFDEAATISVGIVEGGFLDAYASPPRFFGSDGNYDVALLQTAAPEVLRNMWGTVPHTVESSPEYQKFYAEVLAHDASMQGDNPAARYDAYFLLALAMQKAGSIHADDLKRELGPISKHDDGDLVVGPVDWQSAREALASGRGVNYEGASGPIEFTEEGDPSVGTYTVWKVVESTPETFEFNLDTLVDFDLSAP